MSDINITVNDEIVNIDVIDTPVYVEVTNSPGPAGAGVAAGGTTGQVLAKASNTNYDTVWVNPSTGGVPYSGATGDVSLGEYGINVGNVIYDTTPTGIPTEQGATYWDTDAETVALIMNGTIQKVGEDTFYHVRNTTGSTIAKGTAVRFSGTTGNSGRLLIAPMLADGTYPSQYYMGITSEELVNNADGKVYNFGKMRNINTSAFADGDVLYVSPSVAGALTATAPVAPNNIIVAAAVVHAANNGTLMIRTTLGSNINADEGVLLTTPTANQGLFYDSGLWVNKSITSALGYTPANAATTLTINGVTYDLSTSRTWTIAAGLSGTIATGQVAFGTAADTIGGSNNLFWESTTGRLDVYSSNPPSIRVLSAVNNTYNTAYNTNSLNFSGSGQTFSIQNNSTSIARFHSTNNFTLGTTSDLGVRFGVVGDTLLRGSGNTSSTTALTVQNSSSTNLFTVRNDGVTSVNILSATGSITTSSSLSAFTLTTSNTITALTGSLGGVTSGTINAFLFSNSSFSPSSGNASINGFTFTPTINQTGGANGITRGLYVNPTLTSAADFRAIETTAGNVLFGSNFFWDNANGALAIGGTTIDTNIALQINSSKGIRISGTGGGNGYSIVRGIETSGFANNGSNTFIVSTNGVLFLVSGSEAFRVNASRNISIGTVSDLGVRLGVVGDTLLRGSGATNATTALTVQNSSSTNLFSVLNNGNVGIGNNAPTNTLTLGSASAASLQVSAATFYSTSNSGNAFSVVSASSVSAFDRPTYQGIRARGSLLSPAAVSSGDFILSFLAAAYDGSAIQYSGAISFDAAANATVGNAPININFLTGSTGAGRTNRMTVKATGQIRFVPLASAPSGAEAGDVYYDSTLNKLRVYTTAWETITSI